MIRRLIEKLVDVRSHELLAMLVSTVYFFCLLAAYYVIRPMREEVGANDRDFLNWLWSFTFLFMIGAVPLYSWLTTRFPRSVFIPIVYRFFMVNLLVFFTVFMWYEGPARLWIDRAFYVWVSVFNLFVITIFWGFMADCFSNEQGKRLFGFVAVGGTVGAIAGSFAVGQLATYIQPIWLLFVSIALLEIACHCVRILNRQGAATSASSQDTLEKAKPIPGSALDGFLAVAQSPYLAGICGYFLCMTVASSFIYLLQAHVVGEAFDDRAERTAFFANVNLWVNCVTLVLQIFLTGRIIRTIGIALTLITLPVVCGVGFLIFGGVLMQSELNNAADANAGGESAQAAFAISVTATLWILVVFQVVRKATNYALARPAREVLFTVVRRSEKYRTKSFIDTAVYRGGDVGSAWGFDILRDSLSYALGAISFLIVPIMIAWVGLGLVLGRQQERRARIAQDAPSDS